MWKEWKLNPRYSISDNGLIRNNKTNRLLKPWIDHSGYYIIKFGFKSKNISVHRLVALTFIPNPENKEQINHKDCNKLNNEISNLEWVSRSENCQHSYDNNLSIRRFGHTDSIGSKNAMSKLNEDLVKEIRIKYKNGNYTLQKLGIEYNVSLATIGYIIQRKTWKHI